MSDPTYRIDVEHRPHDVKESPWNAVAHRLSDAWPARSFWAETKEDAVRQAQAWIAAENAPQVAEPGFSVYVDDDGRPVEAHSVKA